MRHSNFYVLLFLYDCLYTLGVDTKLPLLKMLHLTDQILPSAYLPPLYAFLPDLIKKDKTRTLELKKSTGELKRD